MVVILALLFEAKEVPLALVAVAEYVWEVFAVSAITTEVALAAKFPDEDPSDPVTLCRVNADPQEAPICQLIVFWLTPAVAVSDCGAWGTVVAVIDDDVVAVEVPLAFVAVTVKA